MISGTFSRQLLFYLLLGLGAMWGAGLFAQNHEFEWGTRAGRNAQDQGVGLAVDQYGNVYTAGYYSIVVDFDPGPGTENLTSNGGADIFVQKLNPSGDLIWAASMGGNLDDWGYDVEVANDGSVYVTGIFQSSGDFDPGPGTFTLTSEGVQDVFLCKLDSMGNFVWAKSFGDRNRDYGHSLDVDAAGNIYLTGYFQDTVDMDPGLGVQTFESEGFKNCYLSKFDPAGNLVWAKQLESPGWVEAEQVLVDALGNPYLCGRFIDTVDFDPGPGVMKVGSNTGMDLFICKFTPQGELNWVYAVGGNNTDIGRGIAIDGQGNVYGTGAFVGWVDFDPGPGSALLSGAGSGETFINKLDSNGNLKWVRKLEGTGNDAGHDIVVGQQGQVFTIGSFDGMIDMDPGPGIVNFNSRGSLDAFISCLDSSGNYVWAKHLSSTGLIWGRMLEMSGSDIFYAGGAFEDVMDIPLTSGTSLSSLGHLDSYTLKFNTCPIAYSTLNAFTCDTYISPSGGAIWDSAGTYRDTLTRGNGCDSILTVNLTIGESNIGAEAVSACDTFFAPSGLGAWVESGVYYDTLSNVQGCDSITAYLLTIQQVDISLSVNADFLTAQASNASFQWIDCQTGMPLPGENAPIFSPWESGEYAVIVYQNGCVDTSDCYPVLLTDRKPGREEADLRVYPNPATNRFLVEVPERFQGEKYELTLFDLSGKAILASRDQVPAGAEKLAFDLDGVPAGVYLLEVRLGSRSFRQKLIISNR